MAELSPADRAYLAAKKIGLGRLTRHDIAAILDAAASRQGPGAAEHELRRLGFIEQQVRELARQWRGEGTGSGPEDIALDSCARGIEAVLAAAGEGPAVDHLAAIEHHLAALRAEREDGRG